MVHIIYSFQATVWLFSCFKVQHGYGLSAVSAPATTRSRSSLSLPGSSLILEPVLGANREYRAPSDATLRAYINEKDIDSILPGTQQKVGVPKRTPFNLDAEVHIIRSSPDLWGEWSPELAIEAAEQHSVWSTGRHHLYPTTDQPAINLPNGMGEAALALSTTVILPSISLAFDVPLERLNFKDMFIAKYEPTGQPGLGRHTDGSAFSFNMLLSDPKLDFEGGGTWIEPVDLVKPEMGDVLMHRGSILHEGCPVTQGVRYVLVGFVQCDDDDDSWNCRRNSNGESELLLKTIESFPLGIVVEVDDGDERRCATIVGVSGGGAASAADIQKGDCARGIILPGEDFVDFDGKTFDQVMEILASRKGHGPVQMVVERWCSELKRLL
jgi:hypothetical protein